MAQITVQYPDELLLESDAPRAVVKQEMRFLLAVKLFEIGRLSLGKAAEAAAMPKIGFMDALGKMGIPIINFDAEEIQAELHAIHGNHHRG